MRLDFHMIIAITGNIGSGKSAACEIFKKRGFAIINADIVGHELYENTKIMRKVVEKFGQDTLTDGQIDRNKLKHIVFYNPDKLKELNKIMHPAIMAEVKRRTKKLGGNIAIEAALILKTRFRSYDKLLLITIRRDRQIERLLKKGKYTLLEIENIIRSQPPQEELIEHADIIVDNSGTKKEFEQNIRKVITRL